MESEDTGARSRAVPRYSCVQCGTKLIAEHSLKIHIQFSCPYGPRKTGKPLHPDDPRECFFCQRSFKTDKALRGHLINDCQTAMRFCCQMCGYTSSWGHLHNKHMFRVHPELMEVLDSALRAENSGNQPNEENLDSALMTANRNEEHQELENEGQREAGDEEDSVVTGDEDQVVMRNENLLEAECEEEEEQQLETGNNENDLESEKEGLMETEETIDLTDIERVERIVESVIYLSDCEDMDPQINPENDDKSKIVEKERGLGNNRIVESVIYLSDCEDMDPQINPVNDDKSKIVNKERGLGKQCIQNQGKFTKKTGNNQNRNKTSKGVKGGKDKEERKRKREGKENDFRKKTKSETKKKKENKEPSQRKNHEVKEGEENVRGQRNEDEEKTAERNEDEEAEEQRNEDEKAAAVLSAMDFSIDLLMEGLPRMSEEELRVLAATDPFFQG